MVGNYINRKFTDFLSSIRTVSALHIKIYFARKGNDKYVSFHFSAIRTHIPLCWSSVTFSMRTCNFWNGIILISWRRFSIQINTVILLREGTYVFIFHGLIPSPSARFDSFFEPPHTENITERSQCIARGETFWSKSYIHSDKTNISKVFLHASDRIPVAISFFCSYLMWNEKYCGGERCLLRKAWLQWSETARVWRELYVINEVYYSFEVIEDTLLIIWQAPSLDLRAEHEPTLSVFVYWRRDRKDLRC